MRMVFSQPMLDNTTQDWFGLQGREENGWDSDSVQTTLRYL